MIIRIQMLKQLSQANNPHPVLFEPMGSSGATPRPPQATRIAWEGGDQPVNHQLTGENL